MMPKKTKQSNTKSLDLKEKQFEKELLRNYEIALKNIRKQLADLYEKSNGSFAEAIKYNRLISFEEQVIEEIKKLSKKDSLGLTRQLRETFHDASLREFYLIEKQIGQAIDFTMMNKNAIAEAIKNPYDRIGFVKRAVNNAEQLANQVRQEIAQGLIQGKSFQETSKQLKRRMELGASKALTITRTETQRVRAVAEQKAIEEASELGVKMKKMWLASIDDSTRDGHAELDGTVLDIDENFVSPEGGMGFGPSQMNNASDDINCRCTLLTYVEGFEPTKRRVRDHGVVDFTTYKEWEKTRDIPIRK